MVIKSIAQLDELSSPYYLMNKEFCQELERFIASKRGLIKGSYNVWSYNAIGKIPHKNDWTIKCNKGTYASSGNLFLSSKKQVLRVTSTWSATNLTSDSLGFRIVKKNFLHSLNPKWNSLTRNVSYSIKTKHPDSKLQDSILVILSTLLDSEKIMTIDYSNNQLTIKVHTEEIHQNIINKLLQL